jgi:hypothetical protein
VRRCLSPACAWGESAGAAGKDNSLGLFGPTDDRMGRPYPFTLVERKRKNE